MKFRYITGKLGSGKTLIAVGAAMTYLKRGATVATNVDFYPERFSNKYNRNINIIRLPDHPTADDLQMLGVGNPTLEIGPDGEYEPGPNYNPEANSLLLLDELAQFMNSRAWNDKGRAALISYLVLLRKMGWDAYFIVQNIDMIDKQIKEALAQETGYCTNLQLFNVPILSPIKKLFTGKPLKLPKVHKCTYRFGHLESGIKTDSELYQGKHLYRLYNTAQKLSPEYSKATYCLLTPWHLVGRYNPRIDISLAYLFNQAFKGIALLAWSPFIIGYYILNGKPKYGNLH